MRMAFSLLLPVRVRIRTSICKALQPGALVGHLPRLTAGEADRNAGRLKNTVGVLWGNFGGRGGIRTHGALAGTPVFKTGALNHSATLPFLDVCDLAGVRGRGKRQKRAILARRLTNHRLRITE